MRRAGQCLAVLARLGEHSGFEERLDQAQYALVLDPCPHPVHDERVREVVEGRLDVRVQHPAIPPGAEVVDLGDRVLSPALGPKPVGSRQEVGLEDGFEHQFQRCLHDPVRDARYTELANPSRPARLGDLPFPYRQRPKRAVHEGGPQVTQETRGTDPLLDLGDGQAVDAGSVPALVARDPGERHDQCRRVVHEVEQVIEPAAGIGHRPTVKLGLHLRYPRPRPARTRARSTAIQRRVFLHCSILIFSKPLPPFPM